LTTNEKRQKVRGSNVSTKSSTQSNMQRNVVETASWILAGTDHTTDQRRLFRSQQELD